MRTIIKITKQEAIEAWKQVNSHISQGEYTTVEIEEVSLIGSRGDYGTFVGNVPYLNSVTNL